MRARLNPVKRVADGALHIAPKFLPGAAMVSSAHTWPAERALPLKVRRGLRQPVAPFHACRSRKPHKTVLL